MAVMTNRVHSVLRVRQDGALVLVQPWEGDEVAGPSLTIDLSTGHIKLMDMPAFQTKYADAFGVAGLAQLVDSYALVLLTGGEAVSTYRCCFPVVQMSLTCA